MMRRLIASLVAGALLAAVPAAAKPKGEAIPVDVAPPERMSTLVVYGNDPCPQSQGDEIVVCARQPESERYRVPKRFRRADPGAAGESWANRAATLEYVGRAGTPNSCSPVGSGGQTGCYTQFLAQSRQERQLDADAATRIP